MSNTINFKAIIQYLAAIAKREAGECGKCEGVGNYDDAPDGSCSEHIIPCPDCADLRRVAEMKWVENWCLPPNPVTDSDAIVSLQKAQDWLSTVRSKLVHTIHADDLADIARRIDCKINGFHIVEKGFSPNPTFTIPSLRSYMEIVGVWEKFAGQFVYDIDTESIPYSMGERIDRQSVIDVINTVTSPTFFEVAARFLKGEVEG